MSLDGPRRAAMDSLVESAPQRNRDIGSLYDPATAIDCPCGRLHATPSSPLPDARHTCHSCGRVRAWNATARAWRLVAGRPGIEVPPLDPAEEVAARREARRLERVARYGPPAKVRWSAARHAAEWRRAEARTQIKAEAPVPIRAAKAPRMPCALRAPRVRSALGASGPTRCP